MDNINNTINRMKGILPSAKTLVLYGATSIATLFWSQNVSWKEHTLPSHQIPYTNDNTSETEYLLEREREYKFRLT